MSGCTSAALSPVEGCCGNGGVRGVRGRCWGRNNRLEKLILNKKTFNIAKDCFLTSAQRESFSISGRVRCGTNYQGAGLVQVGKVFPGFSE